MAVATVAARDRQQLLARSQVVVAKCLLQDEEGKCLLQDEEGLLQDEEGKVQYLLIAGLAGSRNAWCRRKRPDSSLDFD